MRWIPPWGTCPWSPTVGRRGTTAGAMRGCRGLARAAHTDDPGMSGGVHTQHVQPVEPERLLDDLDPEQRTAALAVSGPVAILAGAGSGKTRVISHRTAYAIATEVVAPDQDLVVTFTEKAAAEMVSRLQDHGLAG